MQYFIWDFTACKSKHLELSVIIQEGLEGGGGSSIHYSLKNLAHYLSH